MSDEYNDLMQRLRSRIANFRRCYGNYFLYSAWDAQVDSLSRDLAAARLEIEEKVSAIEAMDKAYMAARRECAEMRARAIEECRQAALLYPFTERAAAHSNQAVVTNVSSNIAYDIRALAKSKHKEGGE